MKRNTILKLIGEPNLHLYQAPGYFYFAYDDGDEIYETHSVMVDRLNHMDIGAWVEVGKEFMKEVKNVC